jgi:site-specific DNA recombinase
MRPELVHVRYSTHIPTGWRVLMSVATLPRNRRPVRAAIYCRISLASHGDRVKVKRQEKLCRALAKRLGWEVVIVFCDNNKSAWQRNRKRKEWDLMLAAVERGELDALIVYHGDRLIRQPWDLETLLNLADGRGIRVASPVGTRNLDSADDRYQLRIDVAQACRESDNISRRTRDAHADRAAKGIPQAGGYRSFGYGRKGRKVVEAEAAEYRDAVARILAGESKTSLIRDWNKRGVLTTAGNPWGYAAFSKMLTRPRYAGLSVYKGDVVGKGKWKALVDRETWEALQIKLKGAADRHTGAAPVTISKYLLTAIAFHSACKGAVKVHHGSGGQALTYLCADRECVGKVRRNLSHLDAYVIGAVLKRLADPRLWAALQAPVPEDNAAAELAALESKRKSALARFTRSLTMTDAELEAILRDLETQIEAVRDRIAARSSVHVLAGCRDMTRAQWDALPLDRRRAIVRATVTVELLPSKRGRGFDPASVRVLPVKVKTAG